MKLANPETVCLMIVALSLTGSQAHAMVDFNDGGIHDIDYLIDDFVSVDGADPGMRTTVNLLDGGDIVWYLMVYNDGIVNILGGSAQVLGAHQNSVVKMSGGLIETSLLVFGYSRARISGGAIANQLRAGGSRIDLSGGSIGQELIAWSTAVLTIHGWNFAVDGQPVGYGALTSIYGGNWGEEPDRRLTGTLACGGPINNVFWIADDSVILLAPPGDLDSDGDVDFGDLSILARQWRQPGVDYPFADIAPCVGDGIVDFLDLSVLCRYWLEGVVSPTTI
ncbi:MAG: hypothetical protein ACYSUY_04870 [Planctomycetota bacterium]